MKHQLLPPQNISPSLPEGTSSTDAVHIWIDLMKSVDKLVMAGCVSRVGTEQAEEAYRRWYAEAASRHARHMVRLASRLRQVGAN